MHNGLLGKESQKTRAKPHEIRGSKPSPGTKNVWWIRTKLQAEERTRDLARFNLVSSPGL